MNASPPVLLEQRKRDADQLKLLGVFHFVLAAFSFLGLGFVFLHHVFMQSFFGNPEMWKGQPGGGPPQGLLAVFNVFYFVAGGLMVLAGLANVVSGWAIRRRTWRTFSLVVAGVNGLQFPFGTVLGVFTLVVLLRDSVRDEYARALEPDPSVFSAG